MKRGTNTIRAHETDPALAWLDVSTPSFPGVETLIDRGLLPKLLLWPFGRWAAFGKGAGKPNSSLYVACCEYGVGNTLLHRAVLGLTKGDGVHASHLNHNPLDNRRCNLKATTNRLNMRHGMKGVPARGYHYEKSRKQWHAQTKVAGRLVHLGRFATEAEAAAAYAGANVLLDNFQFFDPLAEAAE
jgi:hypothetical protein